MKLKQLDITGFKSFVDKTTVAFPKGISAVVGPNGCGKSNIIDAIRWVMGEQSAKLLRGKSMEDVIFSGTEKKPPLNMAEVALTFINDNGNTPEQYREFSEIMVTRRLFRSGESSYYINKQPCRLKDIQNLLMGTGVGARTYAVIEQGRISTLIDAGPEERRFFIEEAAGITRYKSRKNEALRKIERTQQNLFRINDVISEVKRQMNSLRRQARKAERYKTCQKQIERLEISLATYHYKTTCAEMNETEALLQSLRDTDFKHETELAKLDAAIEQIKQERAVKNKEISEHKAQRYQLQRAIDKLEGDLEYGAKDLERFTAEAKQLEAEIKEIEEKEHEFTLECRKLDERILALQQDIEKSKETLKQKEHAGRALKDRLAELNQALETKKAELINQATRKAGYENTVLNTSQSKASLSRRLEQIIKEKDETTAEIARLEKGLTNANEQLNNLKQSIKEITESIESWNNQLQEKRQALSQQVRKVQTMEAENQKIRSRHAALKKMDENYEWYKEGVRAIMRKYESQDPEQTGIHGLVADVIEPEPSYEDAVEAALGETLQYVIVRNQEGGVAAIDYLHAHSAGRGGFIPIKGLRQIVDTKPSVAVQTGASVLIDHIKVKAGYEQLIQSLLGHVVVAEDLKAALQLWNMNGSGQAVVTRKGDRVCPQGILIGGGPDNEASGILAKKKEIKELGKALLQLETSVAKAKSEQERLQAETIALETQIQKARQIQHQKGQQQIEIEKEIYRLQEKLGYSRQRMEILDLETQQIKGEETDLEQELCRYQDILSELDREIQSTEAAIARKSAEVKEVSEGLESFNQNVMALRLELTTLQAERDSAQNTLRRLRNFQDDRLTKLNHLTKQLKQKEQDKVATQERLRTDRDKIARLYMEIRAMEEALAEMEAEYQTIEGRIEENDQALSGIRSAQQEALQKIQQLELKQAERRIRLEHLVNRIKESYHCDIESSDHEQHDTEAFSIEQIEETLARYREQMTRIGDVNLAAIEEHETLEERYRFLTEQRNDLVEAIEALRRVISKINRTSLKQFMKTFKAVNEKLQEVFPRLFEGGIAKLVLIDPKRPLESGVSYFVHPPGKKLTRMSLLSGGEKALAAIAFIFSLFLIKPTGFCVLDEIDAPLDEANTHRFNNLLRQIGQESQVILITHNKRTMEVADGLFGVTMEDQGISKLISINLESKQPSLKEVA
ncbi:MAG: chromosome segregation protein SMC [Deltaproteobacteria bacterium]|nr:MAG: chromosome segregation protein SMC [Deltaproteobacteria bacterium]